MASVDATDFRLIRCLQENPRASYATIARITGLSETTVRRRVDALIQSVTRAGEYNRDDQVAPAVILWPDKERQWEPVLPVLRVRLPQLLTLGPYAVNCKTGPAFWLLMPVSARKQLNDLPDDLITKVNILYYTDAREALLKAIVE